MTTGQTRQVTMALCGLFLAAALAFAWMAERPAPAAMEAPADAAGTLSAGAAAFQLRCESCHTAEAIAQIIRDAPDRGEKMRALDALLVSHGDATPAEARQILAFLEARAGR